MLALGVSFAAMSVLAGGLNLVYGYTGLLSFAQVGFFGIGGYAAALLVTELGWSLWAGVAAAGGAGRRWSGCSSAIRRCACRAMPSRS